MAVFLGRVLLVCLFSCALLSSLLVNSEFLEPAPMSLEISKPLNGTTVDSPLYSDIYVNADIDVNDWDLCCICDGDEQSPLCIHLNEPHPYGFPPLSLKKGMFHVLNFFLLSRNIEKYHETNNKILETNRTVFVSDKTGDCVLSNFILDTLEKNNESLHGSKTILPPLYGKPYCSEEEVRSDIMIAPAVQFPQKIWGKHRQESYSTHQATLIHHVRATTSHGGDIWELGAGTGSTPLLRILAKESGRILISLEDDMEFLNILKTLMPPTSYHRYDVPSLSKMTTRGTFTTETNVKGAQWYVYLKSLDLPPDYEASVVFIDHSPLNARWWSLMFWCRKAVYIVMHDSPYHPLKAPPITLKPIKALSYIEIHQNNYQEPYHEEEVDHHESLTKQMETEDDVNYLADISYGLFEDASLYLPTYCYGGGYTMVVTMKPQCHVAKPEDVYDL
mmetsp:Transcript_10576/g.12852  ORF Transcript_10576/g.12852 Transcript_10576/m.12852 type:complete len:447 (-) Transcript_10576:79-1419(-)